MIASLSVLLATLALSHATPLQPRVVTSLNQGAFEEAQRKDNGATRAFSGTSIKTSDGQCLFVDKLSGDFRANLNPIQIGACDGSQGQQWDIITKGKHNDQAGTMLVVNTLTQACMNFDPRRAAGNTVIMFSCGGRADGGGDVTNSQLFGFNGGSGPLSFSPKNSAGTCLAVAGGKLDQAGCKNGDAKQSFTFGGAAAGNANPAPVATPAAAKPVATPAAAKPVASPAEVVANPVECAGATAFVTVTRDAPAPAKTQNNQPAASQAAPAASPAANVKGAVDPAIGNPTTPVPVSRAGGTLQPSSAAEAQKKDLTATRAFTSVQLRSGNGLCLFIDPTAGDFRQNLIPAQFATCNANSPTQKFDIITQGKHIKTPNSMLVVSSVMQGCLSFDARRADGDTAHVFSCGGRGDGGGDETSSQVFPFNGGKTFTLAPENSQGKICLSPNPKFGGKLDQAQCNGSADQTFTVI